MCPLGSFSEAETHAPQIKDRATAAPERPRWFASAAHPALRQSILLPNRTADQAKVPVPLQEVRRTARSGRQTTSVRTGHVRNRRCQEERCALAPQLRRDGHWTEECEPRCTLRRVRKIGSA